MITNNILFFYIPQCKYNKDTISFAMHELYENICNNNYYYSV